jgi:TolB-like protein
VQVRSDLAISTTFRDYVDKLRKFLMSESGEAVGQRQELAEGPLQHWDVFVSYSSQDASIADALVETLERNNVVCWIAPRNVIAGDLYADGIIRAINGAKAMVLVLSGSAIGSPHVGKEVERASSKRCPIIALRTDTAPLTTALEYFLSESQWVDLANEGTDAALKKVVDAVRHRLSPPSDAERRAPPDRNAYPQTTKRRKAALAGACIGILTLGLIGLVIDIFWLSKHEESARKAPTISGTTVKPETQPSVTDAVFAPPPRSIAVLPFLNMSGDAKQEYFSDGISEELLDSLSRLSDLQVAARTSSFSFKGQNVDVSTIAHKLNVGTILEGSVRRSGNTVRITAQLINAVTGFHIWSQIYDRKLTDILKVQTDVATSVAKQLEVKLAADEVAKIELGGTQSAEAYDAYLRGTQIIIGSDHHAGRAALAEFDHAITLDPQYAKAYAERAWALHSIAISVRNPGDRAGLREQASVAAQRAVALAPDLGEAHAILASIRAYALFDYPDAAPEFDRALALAPGSAQVQTTYAFYAADLGHVDAAVNAARRAVSLDPQNAWSHAVLGSVLAYARRYAEALLAYRDAAVLRPEWRGIAGKRTQVLLAMGQVELARQECESPTTSIEESERSYCLALAYHFLGRQSDAQRELTEWQALDGEAAAGSYTGVYAQWGDTAAALRWLSAAEHLRDPLLWQLKVDWHVDPIRNEPQFKAVVARMNFPP